MSKLLRLSVAVVLAISLAPLSAQANPETWTIGAQTTLDTNPGYPLEIDETGFPPFEIFFFPESGYLRAYALREAPAPWENLPAGTYVVRESTMFIGQSWVGIPTDDDVPVTATVRALESITTPAGTFLAYKVEGGLSSNTAILDYVFWFADGVGMVRQDYYNSVSPGNPFDLSSELISYSIAGGSGFFPLAEGNTWSFDDAVPNVETSFGGIKALFD